MTKFKRATFYTYNDKARSVFPENGYSCECLGYELYVHNINTEKDKRWRVSDKKTGMSTVAEGATREEALRAFAKNIDMYEKVIKSARYQDLVRHYQEALEKRAKLDADRLVANKKIKDKYGDDVEIKMEAQDGAVYEVMKDGVCEVVVNDCKTSEKISAVVQDEPVRNVPKAPKAKKDDDDIEIIDKVTVTVIDQIREFVKDKDMIVMQKSAGGQYMVIGNTKPYKDELRSLGLSWAPKASFWYISKKKGDLNV